MQIIPAHVLMVKLDETFHTASKWVIVCHPQAVNQGSINEMGKCGANAYKTGAHGSLLPINNPNYAHVSTATQSLFSTFARCACV